MKKGIIFLGLEIRENVQHINGGRIGPIAFGKEGTKSFLGITLGDNEEKFNFECSKEETVVIIPCKDRAHFVLGKTIEETNSIQDIQWSPRVGEIKLFDSVFFNNEAKEAVLEFFKQGGQNIYESGDYLEDLQKNQQ